MRLARRLTFAASAVGVALAVASCGKTSPAGAQGDGGSESPCDDYFTAVYGCVLGSTFPASERARIRPRYDQTCASMLSLPGMNITASFLGQCTMAAETYGCGAAGQNDCEAGGTFLAAPFYVAAGGALGGGAACVLPQQCQTYQCSAGSSTADGGTLACGTCSPPIAGGQSCAPGGVSCATGTLCAHGGPAGGDAGMAYTCIPIAHGGSGAACDGDLNECNPGLSCNGGTGFTCSSPGPAGTACGGDGDCQPGLVCNLAKDATTDASAPGARTCSPRGEAGTPCGLDEDCLAPLVCPASPGSTSTCRSPGQAGAQRHVPRGHPRRAAVQQHGLHVGLRHVRPVLRGHLSPHVRRRVPVSAVAPRENGSAGPSSNRPTDGDGLPRPRSRVRAAGSTTPRVSRGGGTFCARISTRWAPPRPGETTADGARRAA